MESQSAVAPMEFLLLEEVQFLEVQDDDVLSQWEFVDVLDTEEGGVREISENGDDSVQSPFGSYDSSSSLSISPDYGPIRCRFLHPDVEMEENRGLDDGDGKDDRCFDDGDADRQVDDNDGESDDDDDDDDGDGYDLDDELVPWSVSNKFGRQRMRKLGKRAFSKMPNSKKSPYLFLRPGCVHGKHGLGLKHNY